MNWYGQSIATGGGSEKPIDQILVEKYGLDKFKGTAVECGANDGLFLSTCLTLEEIGWKVINIEASLPNFLKLKKNRPKSKNYFFALSDGDFDTIEINHYDGDNGGVDHSAEYKTCMSDRFPSNGSNLAITTTYHTLIREPVGLLVLDVEGYEIKVLTGMFDKNNDCFNANNLPEIICVEHTHCGLFEIKHILNERGYNLDFVDGLNAVFVI